MRRKSLRRLLVILSILALAFVPGMAAADGTTLISPPVTPGGGVDLSVLDPELIAEMKEVEQRVVAEEQQAQQLTQQKQQVSTKIQANNQASQSVDQKVSDWNTQAQALEEKANALNEQIDAHNAEPHTFELPDQQAAADAYQAEAAELQSQQNEIQSEQSQLDAQKSELSGEQDQINTEGQQLENQKQQINQQIQSYNSQVTELESQVQQLLQQVLSALQSAEQAQQSGGTQGDPDSGGDQGSQPDAAEDDGQAGDDGGDAGSPKTTDDALTKYAQDNDVEVYQYPVRALLTPGTVTRLSPGTAAGLSPYQTYDGLVYNPDRTYTALEVQAPGAKPDPFDQAINQGGRATVVVGGQTLTITRVEMVPGGQPSPDPPSVPAPDPTILPLMQDNGQVVARDMPRPGQTQTSPGQDEDKLPAGTELARPLPGENSPDPNNKPRQRPDRCTENWQDYGPVQTVTFQGATGQRATGAEACVVSTSAASRAKLSFALFGMHTDEGMARCHLIGHELNGSDSDLRNFVPCYQNPTNNSWMYYGFESKIANQVKSGDPVYLVVRPVYAGQDPLPIGIIGFAASNKGWGCSTFIPNVTTDQSISITGLFEGC